MKANLYIPKDTEIQRVDFTLKIQINNHGDWKYHAAQYAALNFQNINIYIEEYCFLRTIPHYWSFIIFD